MKRWFLFVLKAGSVFATLGLLTMAAYGLAFSWQVAEDALPQFRGSPRLLVGFAYESLSVNGRTTESKSHTYAIVPSAFRTLTTVEVTKDEHGVRVEFQPFGFLEILLVFAVGLFGVWWFFIRRSTPASRRNGRP